MSNKKAKETEVETNKTAVAPAEDETPSAEAPAAEEVKAANVPAAETEEIPVPPVEPNAEETAETGDGDESVEVPDVIKSGFFKVRVEKFSGTYKDAQFGDDGVCERISFTTLESLRNQYPGARITPLEAL